MDNVTPLLSGTPPQAMTLDNLWREAERLGPVEVSADIFKEVYQVRIRIKSASGGSGLVWPSASDKDIFVALSKALDKARAVAAVLADHN